MPIYGSDRIGTYNPPSETNINSDIYILNRSYKRYELKDHLGNVRVTVSDSKRVSFVSETLVFSADIKTYTDYYAFGMEMVGRNWSEGDAYRQGYNGKENDKDFGEGVQDYGMRVSDTQVARFFSVDPITAQYPELTPYQFASNRPIDGIDLDGLEWQGYGAGFGMSRNQMRVYQESRDHDIKNPKQYTAEEIAKANSFFADFIPIISQTKAGTEVATGIDPITKKPASRVLAAMGFVPFGKIIGKGAKWVWNGITSIFRKGKKGKIEVGEAEIIAIGGKKALPEEWDVVSTNMKHDADAHALAKEFGGQPQAAFKKAPNTEYDVISDDWIVQAKCDPQSIGQKFRDQARRTFEAAQTTDRKVFYQFKEEPHRDIRRKLTEYSERYNVNLEIRIKK